MSFLIGILGAVLGIAIGFLIARSKVQQKSLDAARENVELEKEVAVLQSRFETEVRKMAELKEESALRLEEQRRGLECIYQKSLAEQKERFDEISRRLVAEAKNATEAMVKQRQKEFAESGNVTMAQLVNPLKETIAKMEQTMSDTTLKQVEANTSLKDILSQAIDSNTKTRQTADDLIRAFRHDSKVQGDWGERVLEEVLESLGLEKGVHFDVQATLRDANGATLRSEETNSLMRPDVIVHLDSHKDVVVDSKVSMKDFMDYMSAEDPDQRKECLRRHVESLKKHVKELSMKDYSSYVKAPKKTMDFVVMFVPRAAALWTALAEDHMLWRNAFEKNVYIADEQSLYAMLRMVKLTWRQVQQAENQQKVFELANEMLKRVGVFVKQMDAVGKSLENAQGAYNAAMSKFAEKGQSVLTTCRQLERLGAKQDSRNPLPSELAEIEMQGIEADRN